jgi:alpha-glucuronidase
VIQDLFMNLDDAVEGAESMLLKWESLRDLVAGRLYEYTRDNLANYVADVMQNRERMINIIEKMSGRKYTIEVARDANYAPGMR